MNIRDLRPGDAARFQEVRLRGLEESPSAFASSHEEECGRTLEEVAEWLDTTEASVVFGAFEGDRLVGILGLKRESKVKLVHKAWVWGMYVAPDFRGRGAGRELVCEALRRARAIPGLRRVLLGVNAVNLPAIKLYEANGFREYAREPDFMLIDGEPQEEILMVFELREK